MISKRFLLAALALAVALAVSVIATATAREGPAVTAFAVSPSTFSATTTAAAAGAAARRGTTIRFRLAGRAVAVTVTVARRLPGRSVRGRCVKAAPALRRRPACTRSVRAGAITRRTPHGGRVSLRFSGRVGGRVLAPGRYRATIVARDARRRHSRSRTTAFTVVRAGARDPAHAPGSPSGSAGPGSPAGSAAPGAAGGFPDPATTGVPAGWTPTHTTNGDLTITTPGAVLDGELVTGTLHVNARNVTIRNSWIYGSIDNQTSAGLDYGGMVIEDSDVGPPSGDGGDTFPAVLVAGYTMTRVHVHNMSEGPRVAAFNNPAVPASSQTVVIRDSLIQIVRGTCSHNDGIQGFGEPPRAIIDHNTIDTRAAGTDCTTGAIFVGNDNADQITVTNNLLAGGGYTMRLGGPGANGPGGTYDHVSGNRIVDASWGYGPVYVDACATVADWSDNSVVTVDADYAVTSTVRPLTTCP
jgi:hypothetical protein